MRYKWKTIKYHQIYLNREENINSRELLAKDLIDLGFRKGYNNFGRVSVHKQLEHDE